MENKLEDFLKIKIREHREKDVNQKNLTQTTIDFYAARVRLIFEEFGNGLELDVYLRKYAKVMKDLQKKYPNKKTLSLTVYSIITVLEATKGKKLVITKYREKFKELGEQITKENESVLKSPKEVENWTSRAEIHDKIKELKEALEGKEGAQLFDAYQRYLVLNLYTLIPPLRNNFVDAVVYQDFSTDITIQDHRNYIFLNEKILILNKYKTKGTYGILRIDLPQELIEIISGWMRIRTTIYNVLDGRRELLFHTRKRTPMTSKNLIKYLNRIFGKKVSTSMLRKVYLSEKYPAVESSNEMRKDATIMGHSVYTQQLVYRKK